MKREDLRGWTRERLEDEIISQDSRASLAELCFKIKEEENEKLIEENQALKKSLQEEKSNVITFKDDAMFIKVNTYTLMEKNMELEKRIKELERDIEQEELFNEEEDKDKLIAELQDQHQQDCIRYNDMRTAYLATLDEMARLREQFGVGR